MTHRGSTLQSPFDQGELHILTERVDDMVLLIGNMIKMHLPGIIDQHIPRQGPQANRSWGWTATSGLADLLTDGDHRQVCVVDYLKAMHNSVRRITGQQREVLDFDDDRLTHLLSHWSQKEVWQAMEQELSEQCLPG